MEQEPELEVLRQRWQHRKDIYEAVAWRYWKGQPQHDEAKAQKDQAYEDWQAAKRARATPRLATLYQRRQRALDRARKRLERTMQDADEELRQHKEKMAQFQEQIRQDQLRIDEADAGLQEVARQVAASADADKDEDEGQLPSGAEVRNQAAGARKGLEAARDKLQDLHDQLEEQGNFVACEQINLLCGAIAGAAGNIEGVESLLERPRPRRQQQQAEYYDMDSTANADKPATDRRPGPRTTTSTNRWDAKPRVQGGSKEAAKHSDPPSQAARTNGARQVGGDDATATTTSTDATEKNSSSNGNGEKGVAVPNVIRFGGAISEEQEHELLRKEAEQALEQARDKFKDAERSQDTDKAALLFAHQLVLTKIGVPATLEQREAYERWRGELGANLERVAAERLKDGGAYW